jgi:hypothetical protein
MKDELVVIPVSKSQKVSGILSIPDAGPMETGIIIAHGAGNDMSHPLLASLAAGLANAGYLALRFNFLYREMGKKGPDNQDLLYIAWQGAFRFFSEHPQYRPKHILAAGKSMGGRIASQLAAEGMLAVESLVFLGYPLHSPGKRERLQDSHLYKIVTPMLFFAGTRDQLCDLQVLRQVLSKLVAPWALEVIEGGDHSFHVPRSYLMDPSEIYEMIATKTVKWLTKLSTGA